MNFLLALVAACQPCAAFLIIEIEETSITFMPNQSQSFFWPHDEAKTLHYSLRTSELRELSIEG